MTDPLVNKVTDDDGTERYVAAGGPSDTESGKTGVDTVDQATGRQEQADPNDPDADQPAQVITSDDTPAAPQASAEQTGPVVTEEADNAATPDAADRPSVDTRTRNG